MCIKSYLVMKLNYDFKDDLILKIVKDKSVLHIGSCDYPYHIQKAINKNLLHQKIELVSKLLIGTDFDVDSINDLKKYNINNIIYFNLEGEIPTELLSKKFDYIILGDVFEHIGNLKSALNNLNTLCISTSSKLILTTPNVFNLSNLFTIFGAEEKVHPDHFFWPSYKTTKKILGNYFKIISFKYVHHGGSDILKNNFRAKIGLYVYKLFSKSKGTLFFIAEPLVIKK